MTSKASAKAMHESSIDRGVAVPHLPAADGAGVLWRGGCLQAWLVCQSWPLAPGLRVMRLKQPQPLGLAASLPWHCHAPAKRKRHSAATTPADQARPGCDAIASGRDQVCKPSPITTIVLHVREFTRPVCRLLSSARAQGYVWYRLLLISTHWHGFIK